MKKILRKTLLIIALFAPLFLNTDCKKQKKCGCQHKDELYPLEKAVSYVYFDDESTIITMTSPMDPYSYFTVCNIDFVRPKIANFKTGEELIVTGSVFWDCNYVMQQSQYSYQVGMRAYNIYVTDIYKNQYGKDDSNQDIK